MTDTQISIPQVMVTPSHRIELRRRDARVCTRHGLRRDTSKEVRIDHGHNSGNPIRAGVWYLETLDQLQVDAFLAFVEGEKIAYRII